MRRGFINTCIINVINFYNVTNKLSRYAYRQLTNTWVNSGCRCPSIGIAMAFSTRGGQLEGPGPIRVFCGKHIGLNRLSGGGVVAGDDDMHLDAAWPVFLQLHLQSLKLLVSKCNLREVSIAGLSLDNANSAGVALHKDFIVELIVIIIVTALGTYEQLGELLYLSDLKFTGVFPTCKHVVTNICFLLQFYI